MVSVDEVQDISPRDQYVAAAAQTAFDYSFPIFADADLTIYVDDTLQVLTTNYTVTGAGNETGGTVTFVAPMTGDEVVTIYRDIAIARDTDVQQNGPWSSTSYNDEMDKVFLIMQELENKIGRAVRFPLTAVITNAQAALDPLSGYLGKFLRITSAGLLEGAVALSNTVALSAEIIGELINPLSAAEITAGVTIVDYSKEPGDVLRYGTNTTPGTTDMTAALQAMLDQNKQTGGAACRTHQDTYYISTGLTWAEGGEDQRTWYADNTILTTDQDIDAVTYGPIGSAIQSMDLRLLGHLYCVQTGTSTKAGHKFQQVYQGEFHISSNGWERGYELTSSHSGNVYNNYHIGRMTNNNYGYYANPTGSGWVNENTHHGGRWNFGAQTFSWHIYMVEDSHNNNLWIKPSLEITDNASAVAEGFVYLNGYRNAVVYPRMEKGGASTFNQNHMVIDDGARDCMLQGGYDMQLSTITGRGERCKLYLSDGIFLTSHHGGQSQGPTLDFTRPSPNNSGYPNARLWDLYVSAGLSQGLEIGNKRVSSGGYLLNCKHLGDIVTNNSKSYICIAAHTSGSDDDEPGVGANSDTYWEKLPVNDFSVGASAWVTSTGYVTHDVRFQVANTGAIWTNQTTADTSALPSNATHKIPIYGPTGTLVCYLIGVADF